MDFKETLKKDFPNSMDIVELEKRVKRHLIGRGYHSDNTLFAHCICRDEINTQTSQALSQFWGESFTLGGLAGIPTSGVTGFGAYASHRPDGGNLLVFFGPHIGIDHMGRLGLARRSGISEPGSTCGSLCLAIDHLQKSESINEDPLDLEQVQVCRELVPYMDGVVASDCQIKTATESIYQVIESRLEDIVKRSSLDCEVVLLGGILINTPSTSDYFAPRKATVLNAGGQSGKTEDWLGKILDSAST